MQLFTSLLLLIGCSACNAPASEPQAAPDRPVAGQDAGMHLTIPATADFDVTGDGSDPAWERAAWTPLSVRRDGGLGYATRFKMLYSETGLYILFDGADRRLIATLEGDYLKLWNEDVYEFFFWTDEAHPLYFEYEISPLGYELPLIIPNFDGTFFGWIPWQYDGERLTRKAVAILGGPQTSGAEIEGWRAEVFVPYALLAPLPNVPPQPGTRWRANFYRIDYDDGQTTYWSWSPIAQTFHEYERFGTITFE
jgi:hypothetical protein